MNYQQFIDKYNAKIGGDMAADLRALVEEAVGEKVALAKEWRKKASDSRDEADRIRRTVKQATGAEERCMVRAEIWEQCADALEARGEAHD